MKKKLINAGLMIVIAVIAISCQKDDINSFNDSYDAVRFPSNYLNLSETNGYDINYDIFRASYSFIADPFDSCKVYDLPVMLIGKKKSANRTIAYTIDNNKSNAPADSYEIMEAIIPSDSLSGYIRIKLRNLEILQDSTYELYINLKTSDSLAVGPYAYTHAVLQWNNEIPAPSSSQHIRTYNMLINSSISFVSTSLANYSPNALKAIVTALGWDDWDSYAIHSAKYNSAVYGSYKYLPRYSVIYGDGSYKSYALKFAAYIKAYNESHPNSPLTHDAGALKGQLIEARSY
jgi:hypothetical protein